MKHQSDEASVREAKPHLGWVFGIAIVGVGILVLTLITAGDATASVWQSIGGNIGTALVLAALLVFIEPRFTTRIAKAAAKSAETKYETRVEALTERVDNLQESTQELFDRYGDTEDQAVNDMSAKPDFYTVSTALVEANKTHAIDRLLGVTVPAATGIPEVLVRFRYMVPTGARPGDHSRDFLDVTPSVLVPASNGHFWPREQRWLASENPDEVGARLMKSLQAAGLKDVETRFAWHTTLDQLVRALGAAFESKRTAGKLVGHVIEMGPNGWFLTSSGIEHMDHGIVVDIKRFPPKLEMFLGAVGAMAAGKDVQEVEADHKMRDEEPDWADSDEWRYVLDRAHAVFPSYNHKSPKLPPAIGSTVRPKRPEARRPAPTVFRGT